MPDDSANDAGSRREEILETALELLAEHGYAGASLRKLATRLGIAQPSLYHYFRTKEDLVEQVLATYAGKMFSAPDPRELPRRLEDVPRFAVTTTLRVYDRPSHPQFVRVAVAVSRINERFHTLLRRVFVDNATLGIRLVMRPFVAAGEIEPDDAVDLVRMMINAVALRMVEDKVMFDVREPGPDLQRFTEFVIRAGEAQVRALKERQGDAKR